MRPYILSETNWKTVNTEDYQLAVLPWGATEAHNFHLPYSTDCVEASLIAAESTKIAWEMGGKVIVLPHIPFGVNTGQLDLKLVMNIYPSTQYIILNDIVETLDRQGIYKLAIVNSHGGNDFRQMIRELGAKFPKMFITVINWYKIHGIEDMFEDLGEHAGEIETSLMLYLKPELVLPLSEAGVGHERKFKFRAIREGWGWAERKWSSVTKDTGIGNPAKATKEKGEKLFNLISKNIGDYLYELSSTDNENLYE